MPDFSMFYSFLFSSFLVLHLWGHYQGPFSPKQKWTALDIALLSPGIEPGTRECSALRITPLMPEGLFKLFIKVAQTYTYVDTHQTQDRESRGEAYRERERERERDTERDTERERRGGGAFLPYLQRICAAAHILAPSPSPSAPSLTKTLMWP
jgi:hypothetical protein